MIQTVVTTERDAETVTVTRSQATVAANSHVQTVSTDDEQSITATSRETDIVVAATTSTIVADHRSVDIVSAGTQGPAGPQGPPAANPTYLAGETISAFRLVYLDPQNDALFKASSSNATANSAVGITTSAVSSGDSVQVTTSGEVSNDTWNWSTAGDLTVYLAADGQVTRTPPTSGYSLRVGFVTSPTSIFVSLKDTIALN